MRESEWRITFHRFVYPRQNFNPAGKVTKVRLLNSHLVSIIFSTNSSTYYSLVGRAVIKGALGKTEEISIAPTGKLDIPDSLFECIIDYDDLKDEIRSTLREGRKSHYLLIGPPATAKSLFLMELGSLSHTYPATGSMVSGAGLTDAFFTYQPRILLLDEIDNIPMDATAILLSVMESGDVLEAKYKRHRGLKLDLTVLAAGNWGHRQLELDEMEVMIIARKGANDT